LPPLVLAAGFAVSLMLFSGCTKTASDEDLQTLREAKDAVASAQKELGRLKAEKGSLEEQLAAKKAKLKAAQQELENVKNR